MQPDTIIPDLSNPQSWNRYSYVTNRPVNFNDPTGHREVNGCSELAGGCNITQKIIDDDKQKEIMFRRTTERLQCWSGQDSKCSGFDRGLKALDNLNLGDGTIQIGIGIDGFTSGLGIRGDVSVAFDFKGNVAFVANGGGGGYLGIGGGVGPFLAVTNAPSVDFLEGNNVEYGGQIGNVATVSTELIHFQGKDRDKYSGISIGAQAELQAPWSFEAHGTATHSAIIGEVVNIPDLIVNLFRP